MKVGIFRAALTAGLTAIWSCGAVSQPSAPMVRIRTATNELSLRCQPPRASVLVDGVSQGSCGWLGQKERAIKLSPGEHVLEVMADGHRPYRAWLHTERMQHSLTIQLQPSTDSGGEGE